MDIENGREEPANSARGEEEGGAAADANGVRSANMARADADRSRLEVHAVRNGREWREVRAIRTRVFIEEQACPPELEWDEHESTSRHMIGTLAGEPVAAARWRSVWLDGRAHAKLERFAVLPEVRGRGLGRRLVQAVMDDARLAGFDAFVVHAQQHLEGFYRSFGFETVGDVFEEAGIPHVQMVRR